MGPEGIDISDEISREGGDALKKVIEQIAERFSDRVGVVVEAGDYSKRVEEIHASMLTKIDELLEVIPPAQQLTADYSTALAEGGFNGYQKAKRLAQLMLLRANVSLWATLKDQSVASHRKAREVAAKNRWAIESAPRDSSFFPSSGQLGELIGPLREMERFRDTQIAPLVVDLLGIVAEFQALDKAFYEPKEMDFPADI